MVPLLVAALSLVAVGAITVLQRRDSAGRSAEFRLSTLKLELAKLQDAPYKANRATGGNPVLAARLMRNGEAVIATTLAELQQHNPPPALARLHAPLSAFYAVLDRVYAIGVSPTGYNAEAGRLVGVAGRAQATAAARLDEAANEYSGRAQRADDEATFGAGATILLLLLAFAFLYRQNGRLLESSRREALTDPLTGLPNRRAFQTEMATGLERASAARPLAPRAFRPRRLQAVQRHLRAPRGRCAADPPRRAPAAARRRRGRRLPDGRRRILRPVAAVAASPTDELVRARRRALTEAGDAFAITLLATARVAAARRRHRRTRTRCDSPTSACTPHKARHALGRAARAATCCCRCSASATSSLATHVSSVGRPRATASRERLGLRARARSPDRSSPPSCTTSARPRSRTRS